MRSGGKSTSGIKSNILGNWEVYNILKENNQKFKLTIIFMKLLFKINQYKIIALDIKGELYE